MMHNTVRFLIGIINGKYFRGIQRDSRLQQQFLNCYSVVHFNFQTGWWSILREILLIGRECSDDYFHLYSENLYGSFNVWKARSDTPTGVTIVKPDSINRHEKRRKPLPIQGPQIFPCWEPSWFYPNQHTQDIHQASL